MSDNDQTTEVVVFTNKFHIRGRVALIQGARLTDFIRSSHDFIAISDVTVLDLSDTVLFQADFLDVSCRYIEVILPASAYRSS